MKHFILLITASLLAYSAIAQPLHGSREFTRADTLRGSYGPDRAWWDVTHYDVTVKPDFVNKSIQGTTAITFRVIGSGQRMQIDLQQPLTVDHIVRDFADSATLEFERDNNIVWVTMPVGAAGVVETIYITYHGTPREAKNAPWDGGWIWKTDAQGNPWMSVACQGLGASVWYPCKDHQSDEPDSAALHITVPDTLQAVGNGRLRNTVKNNDGTTTWNWAVVNPINNYNLVPYIGKYTHWGEVYPGVQGPLDCDYWVLEYHVPNDREEAFLQNAKVLDDAMRQFRQVPSMLKCFEDWFGPYPFYKDSYKLVEAPHLGMEHQSAVAYGNHFQNGYLGRDLSGSGWGLKWDYILVHESGHEWFGNNITTNDIADMWVHEGFTDYSETIYTQCQFGDAAGDDYVVGLRKNISNDKPIIGPYNVNQEGSGDMYSKGANMLHTIRHIINNDSLFKAMLREMNRRYYHKVTTSAAVEEFISEFSHHDLTKLFDQYLRTIQVPVLEWGIKKKKLFVRWSSCIEGFSMPITINVNGEERLVTVSEKWSMPASELKKNAQLRLDRNWYALEKRVPASAIKGINVRH